MCSIPFQNEIMDPLCLAYATLWKSGTFTLYTALKGELRLVIQKNKFKKILLNLLLFSSIDLWFWYYRNMMIIYE